MSTCATKSFWGLTLACILYAATPAIAAPKHPILQQFIAEGNKVEFLGRSQGLDGWVMIKADGGVQYAYTTDEGGLLTGLLFAPDGSSETQKQLKLYKLKSDGSQASLPDTDKSSSGVESAYARTEKSGWFALGESKAPYIYVFMNVTCDHCHAYLKDLDSYIKSGQLQVRLIPYGVKPENRDSGAALLSSDNAAVAWNGYMAGDKSILAVDKVKDGGYTKIDANTALIKTLNIGANEPPFTIYRRPADGTIKVIIGRPENILLLPAEFMK